MYGGHGNTGKSVLLEQAKPLLGKIISHILTSHSGEARLILPVVLPCLLNPQELFFSSPCQLIDHYMMTLHPSVKGGEGKSVIIVSW